MIGSPANPLQIALHTQPHLTSPIGGVSMLRSLDEGLGHELRNLVMPMMLRLDALAQSESLSGRAQSDLQGIRQSVLHLQRIANGLRLISVDPSAQESEDQQTRLHRWWKEIKTIVDDALPAHALVEADFSPTLPAVLCPPGVLSHILLHALTEVRSALEHVGMPQISISAVEHGSRVEIVLTDNGPALVAGTEPRDGDGCFAGRTSDSSATLRLCVASSLARQHGGTLQRTLVEQGGSRLVLSLPAAPDHEDLSERIQKRARLLIMEPRRLAFIRLVLQQRGIVEASGADASEIVICDATQYFEMATRDELTDLFKAGAIMVVIGRPQGEAFHPKVHWISSRELSRIGEYLR